MGIHPVPEVFYPQNQKMHPPAPEKLNYAPKSSVKFVKIKLYQRQRAEGALIFHILPH